ncbi:MAG: gliding motility-associated C-terminal domain-containing protein, partial [Sphingobacteriales bacterium]
MMKTHTFSSRIGIIRNTFVAIIILLTLFYSKSYAQNKVFANNVSAQSRVDNASNATLNDNTFATVNSYGGIAVGIGGYSGELELKYPTPLLAGVTSYIRIDFDGDILNRLLGGSLGGLLANVGGTVVLGNHSFEVGARNGASTVLTGSSTAAFSTDNIKIVKDANGFFYVAIRPAQAYDRVYIKDVTNAVLLGVSNSTRVYNAFYVSGTDPCAQAFATGFEGTGITLDALQLGSSGVTNSERAIDTDPNNFSTLSLGVLGVTSSISQNFYFTTPSNAGDDINLRFSSTPALLTAGVLQNISVTAYSGDTQVYTTTAASLLNLDLLGLLNSGQPVTVPFSPGAAVVYDRVKVTLGSVLTLNATQTINVYGVTRSAPRPTFTAPASNAIAACYNTTVPLTATTANANELIWYDVI